MRVIIEKNYDAMSRWAANHIVERIKAFQHPQCMGIDLNSRFESEPGIKDVEKIRHFLANLQAD